MRKRVRHFDENSANAPGGYIAIRQADWKHTVVVAAAGSSSAGNRDHRCSWWTHQQRDTRCTERKRRQQALLTMMSSRTSIRFSAKAGCPIEIEVDPRLQLAAEWHTKDVLANRNLTGDLGSDGSTVQDRANAAGYWGRASETVAIHPALAIIGIELINKWYYDPNAYAIMSDCRKH
jgi:hypothetical protein